MRARIARVGVVALASLGMLVTAAGTPNSARAHEIRPAYLELSKRAPDTWDVLWKVPTKGGDRLALYVRIPERCDETERAGRWVGAAHVERWRATCPDQLVGKSVWIEGLAATRTDVLVRVNLLDRSAQTVRLTPDHPSFEVARAVSRLEVARSYLGLGVEHILLGVDHLLFVLALLLLVGNLRKLLGAITAFTLAHSLTLAAATLGWVHVPAAPVEAAIALSIVFVAVEVLGDSGGLAKRRPWLVAFAFGLLHGLGFAGALSNIGLPSHAIPIALAFFNIGVEVGQLLFITTALVLFKLVSTIFRAQQAGIWSVADLLARPASYAIGILGAFWLIERTVSFGEVR